MTGTKGVIGSIPGDQYERNPLRHTFKSWVGRYLEAYNCVRYGDYGKPSCAQLFDVNGQRLKESTFGEKQLPLDSQVDAVLDYVKSQGCIIEIPVRDSPGINKPTYNNRVLNKERFLTFDCGLKGMGKRIYAYQHLVVSSSVAPSNWTLTWCNTGRGSFGTQTTGLKRVRPPATVTARNVVRN